MVATPKSPNTNPEISALPRFWTIGPPTASLPTRKFLVPCSVWFMLIPSMKPWNFSAAVPMAIRPRSLQRAAPLPASSATKLLLEISASISASLRLWPISPSAVGKKVSSASFTAKAETPSNFSLSPRLSSSAGRARKPASFSHADQTSPPRCPRTDRVCANTRLAFLHRSRHPGNREDPHFSAHLATRRNAQPVLWRSKRRKAHHRRPGKFFHRRGSRRTHHRRPRQARRFARLQ